MIQPCDLPRDNWSVIALLSLNDAYFHNKGRFLYASPVWQDYPRELGYELYAQIRVYIVTEHPFEFSVFINEKMTDAEIQDALREFTDLTTGYAYDVL